MLSSCFSKEACILGISTFQKYQHASAYRRCWESIQAYLYLVHLRHGARGHQCFSSYATFSKQRLGKKEGSSFLYAILLQIHIFLWESFPFYTASCTVNEILTKIKQTTEFLLSSWKQGFYKASKLPEQELLAYPTRMQSFVFLFPNLTFVQHFTLWKPFNQGLPFHWYTEIHNLT